MNDEFDKSAVYEAMDFSITADHTKLLPEPEAPFKSEDDGILALSAGWMRQNPLSAYTHRKINEWAWDQAPPPVFPRDKNYRAYEDEANFGYDPDQMVYAESEAEAEYIRGQIDEEWAQLNTIRAHWMGTLGELGGAVLRPELYVGGVVGAGRSLGGVVLTEMALEAGSEGLLQAQQRTRTTVETAINVASAGVATALIGKALDVHTQLRGEPPPVRASEDDPDHLGVTEVYDSAGAQRATQDPESARLAPIFGSTRLAELLAWGPGARLTRSKSPIATAANEKLATPSMYTKGHLKGETQGQSIEAQKDALQGEVITVFDRVEVLGRQTNLSPDEFAEEMGKALSNNDRHVIPEVQEAAQLARAEILDPRLQGALDVGHKIEPKPGQSYFPRIHSREKILDDYDGVKRMLIDHYNQVFKGELKDANKIVDVEANKAYSASKKTITKMEANVRKLSKVPARQRTAAQIVKLDKARASLKKAVAANKKMLAKQKPRVQLKVAKAKLATMKLRPTMKSEIAAKAKLKAHIKELEDAQKAYVKEKAAKVVRDKEQLAGDMNLDAERAATQSIQNMMGGLPHNSGVSGVPAHLKQRSLTLTDQMLEPYLEKNAITVLSHYTGGMDPYILMKQEFGETSMQEIFKGITRDYEKLISAAETPKARKALKNQRDRDITDLTAMRNRVLNRVQRGIDQGSLMDKTIQFTKLFNVSTQLGGIVLSSAPDIARPLAAHGFRSFSKSYGTSLRQLARSMKEGNTNATTAQVRRMGVAAQRTLNSRLLDMAELGDAPNSGSNLGKTMDWVQKKWGTYSGFNHWTDTNETLAAHSAMDYVLQIGKRLEMAPGGQLSRSETMKIARMGFTENDVKEFWKHASGTSGGGTIDPVLKFADTLEWNNPELAKLFEAGIGSDVRRAIIRISVGDKPVGMDNTLASLLLQYQSFAIAASNKMLVAGLQQWDAALLQALLPTIFLGGVVGVSKGWLRGDDPTQWGNDKFLMEGIDRSGALGVYNLGFNMMRPLIFDDMPTRYIQRGFQGILGGSTVSQLARMGKIFGDVATGEVDADTGEQAMRLTPLVSNTLHFRQLMQRLGEDQ